MKKFIFKSIIFFFVLGTLLLVLILPIYIKSPSEISTTSYGVNSNHKTKIILVGSSNVFFNYNYEKLNTFYKNYDIIGIQMSATAGFMPLVSKLELLDLSNEDIIIFCMPYQLYEPEYFVNFHNITYQKVLSRRTILNAFKYSPTQAFKNFLALNLDGYLKYIKKSQPESVNVDSLVKINRVQVNLLKNENYMSCKKSGDDNFDIKSLDFNQSYLINFMSNIKKNIETKVYFRFPSVHKGRISINKEKINFMSTNYEFINKYEATVYDSIYWYDQWYHLNRCGAEKNTSLLIDELNNVITGNKKDEKIYN